MSHLRNHTPLLHFLVAHRIHFHPQPHPQQLFWNRKMRIGWNHQWSKFCHAFVSAVKDSKPDPISLAGVRVIFQPYSTEFLFSLSSYQLLFALWCWHWNYFQLPWYLQLCVCFTYCILKLSHVKVLRCGLLRSKYYLLGVLTHWWIYCPWLLTPLATACTVVSGGRGGGWWRLSLNIAHHRCTIFQIGMPFKRKINKTLRIHFTGVVWGYDILGFETMSLRLTISFTNDLLISVQ